MIRRTLLSFCFAVACGLPIQSVGACTIWGAIGAEVRGNGTLIVKNRDWAPDHQQQIKILHPKRGYRSVALVAVGGDEPGTKAGVNERGLVIVTATAAQVTNEERRSISQMSGLTAYLLAMCATVDDVLEQLVHFRRPSFYLVGDRQEIAVIEVCPEGKPMVKRIRSGVLSHTNHYLLSDSLAERKVGVSSTSRLRRIDTLLSSHAGPFTVDEFVGFSEDQRDGPDNGIWRTGSSPRKTRTLATWLVSIPKTGNPRLYVKVANPGDVEHVCRFSLDEALESSSSDTIPLDGDSCDRLKMAK